MLLIYFKLKENTMFKSYITSITILLIIVMFAFAGNGCVKISNVHNLENEVAKNSAERKKEITAIYKKFRGKNFAIPYADIEMVWIPSGKFKMAYKFISMKRAN